MAKQSPTFVEVAELLIEDAKVRTALGQCSKHLLTAYRQRLQTYGRPFFGDCRIADIDSRRLRALLKWLAERKLKASSINPVMSFVSKVLKLAEEEGFIARRPNVPRAAHKDCPRPAFNQGQYRRLLAEMKRVEDTDLVRFKSRTVTWELRAITTFMVNSFLRPGDLFTIRNKHVQIVEPNAEDGEAYLRLNPPASKGHEDPVISMPAAVKIFRRTLERNTAAGFGRPDDFVFLPGAPSRAYAHRLTRQWFRLVLKRAGLAFNSKGAAFTLYSLRHTAIMLRLLNASGLDLITLARNARTSVEMLDRFYAKSLTAEMNRHQLHSFRRPTRYLTYA